MKHRIELISLREALRRVCTEAEGTVYVVDMYNGQIEPLLVCELSIGELKEMYEHDDVALILKGE